MMFIAQRTAEEPWHLVLRADESSAIALCGVESVSSGWWRRRSSPVRPGTAPDGVCGECLEAVEEAMGVDAGPVGDAMAGLSETLQSVRPPEGEGGPRTVADLLR